MDGTMTATSITISDETRRLLETFLVEGATYDDVIRGLLVSHPTELTVGERNRRIQEGRPHPIEGLIRKNHP